MSAIRRSTFAVLVLLFLLSLFGNVAHGKEKPEIVRLDAEYTEMLVKISVHWQSSNPVTVIHAIVGKEQKELKVDEYDNRRNPDGYSGEAVIVVNAAPTAGQDGIPYVVQIEDDLRQKSEQVTGSAKIPVAVAGGGGVAYPGAAGTGAGTWSASGAWSATGTAPSAGSWPAAGPGQVGGGFPSSGAPQGGAWPTGGVPAGGTTQGSAWLGGGVPAGGTLQGGAWPAGSSGGTYGGSPSIGDALTKAQQGMPGPLIDKAIGFVAGSGMGAGSPAGTMGASPPPGSAAGVSPPSAVGAGTGFPQTLQNENFGPGGPASFASILKPGDEVAVVLGPVEQPFNVTKVFFLFGGSSGKGIVTLKVYQDVGTADDGGVLFMASFEVQGSDAALQEVDLAQVGGVVPVPGGNVRVSIQVQHAGLPGLGYDMSANATPGRNWINRSGAWSDIGAAGIRGNGIIRATVSP